MPMPMKESRDLNIFLVDDDDSILRLFSLILSKLAHQVTPCNSAASAIQAYEAQARTIDLLITDVNMPGESGLTLAERLWEVQPELRVIVISGFVDEIPPDWGKMRNCRILSKPIRVSELCAFVQSMGAAKTESTPRLNPCVS